MQNKVINQYVKLHTTVIFIKTSKTIKTPGAIFFPSYLLHGQLYLIFLVHPISLHIIVLKFKLLQSVRATKAAQQS